MDVPSPASLASPESPASPHNSPILSEPQQGQIAPTLSITTNTIRTITNDYEKEEKKIMYWKTLRLLRPLQQQQQQQNSPTSPVSPHDDDDDAGKHNHGQEDLIENDRHTIRPCRDSMIVTEITGFDRHTNTEIQRELDFVDEKTKHQKCAVFPWTSNGVLNAFLAAHFSRSFLRLRVCDIMLLLFQGFVRRVKQARNFAPVNNHIFEELSRIFNIPIVPPVTRATDLSCMHTQVLSSTLYSGCTGFGSLMTTEQELIAQKNAHEQTCCRRRRLRHHHYHNHNDTLSMIDNPLQKQQQLAPPQIPSQPHVKRCLQFQRMQNTKMYRQADNGIQGIVFEDNRTQWALLKTNVEILLQMPVVDHDILLRHLCTEALFICDCFHANSSAVTPVVVVDASNFAERGTAAAVAVAAATVVENTTIQAIHNVRMKWHKCINLRVLEMDANDFVVCGWLRHLLPLDEHCCVWDGRLSTVGYSFQNLLFDMEKWQEHHDYNTIPTTTPNNDKQENEIKTIIPPTTTTTTQPQDDADDEREMHQKHMHQCMMGTNIGDFYCGFDEHYVQQQSFQNIKGSTLSIFLPVVCLNMCQGTVTCPFVCHHHDHHHTRSYDCDDHYHHHQYELQNGKHLAKCGEFSMQGKNNREHMYVATTAGMNSASASATPLVSSFTRHGRQWRHCRNKKHHQLELDDAAVVANNMLEGKSKKDELLLMQQQQSFEQQRQRRVSFAKHQRIEEEEKCVEEEEHHHTMHPSDQKSHIQFAVHHRVFLCLCSLFVLLVVLHYMSLFLFHK